MMFISVDLPEPDGPMIATNSPRIDGKVDAASAVTAASPSPYFFDPPREGGGALSSS